MSLILKPIISEKAMAQTAQRKYVFEVPMSSNKIEIAQAVKSAFKVTVTDVNTTIIKGKKKRLRGITGRRVDRKHAVVSLKKGDSIKALTPEAEEKK